MYEVAPLKHLQKYVWAYEDVNLNLLNGLFLIHPLLLIVLGVGGLTYIFFIFRGSRQYKLSVAGVINNHLTTTLTLSLLLLLTGG